VRDAGTSRGRRGNRVWKAVIGYIGEAHVYVPLNSTYLSSFFFAFLLFCLSCLGDITVRTANTWLVRHAGFETRGPFSSLLFSSLHRLRSWLPLSLLNEESNSRRHTIQTMDTNPNASGSSGILPPLSVIIQWPTPNYEDPVTRSKAVLITSVILGTIMVAVVGARMWARAVIQRNAGLDDWIMVAAMVWILLL
jgi:hypothetical protein